MIDIKLVNKAKKKSKAIEIIDNSWREHVKKLKESIYKLPFQGVYNALIENDAILVEGYCGLLLIGKLYYKRKTYIIKSPVKQDPFRIYGGYNKKGGFEHFVARPEIGFHYMGMGNYGHTICTGDIEYTNPSSLESLKEVSLKIIDSFRLINMESLGTVILPDSYAELKKIFSNKDEPGEKKFEKLLSGQLIEEIL